jgi:hypothetical protein
VNEDPARDGSNWYAYAGNDPINFVDPSGLFAQGSPLNNFSLNAYAGGYSGGRVSAAPLPVYVSPTLSYNPLAAPTFNGSQLFGSLPTLKAPTSSYTPLPTVQQLTNFGPMANINSFNTTDPLYNYTPSKQLTSIRQIGGQSLGDMLMGADLKSARDTIRHSTSMIESFNTQMMVTAGGWLKSAFDVIGPASAPTYERRYSDGSRDFYLGGEPDTGALLNQGMALLPFAVPNVPTATTSSPRSSFYNVADNGIDLTKHTPRNSVLPDARTGVGYGVNDPPVRIVGPWTEADYKAALRGSPPPSLGRPDLHHADQMPGSAIHEVVPMEHRGNRALHPNLSNQGVTPQMRQQDRQLHWWYRAREQGADQLYPDLIYRD